MKHVHFDRIISLCIWGIGDLTNSFQPTFQIPGQQYQPLLPDYDRSFGSYIQDLPSDK
jgi:hypothetical protein